MMGRQIAQVFAQHGHEVEATDEDQQALKTGINEIADGPYGVHAAVSKGKLTPEQASKTLAGVKTRPKLEDACKNSNLVIEAAFEDLQLKQNLFQRIESTAPPTAIIASNTSTLSLDKITQKISKKDRTVGMHFFNPAQLTKLVEIIRGESTSPQTIEKASQIVREIGKTPIIAQDEPGFIANRLGLTLYVEASKLQEDGIASLQDIDTCMKLGYNHPMGPFELADFVGLDTRLRNLESLYRSTNDSKWIPPKLLREMVQQGYLGDPSRKKTSKGGYYEFLQIERRQSSNPLYRTQTTNHR
jgi:3-hydroxybutyryl-CoA dehydrogenase